VRRIAIIGLGLIGGSMGLALKRARLKETDLIGYVRHSETGAKALKLGVVDKVERNLVSAVSQADMVILATPVIAMKEILEQIGAHLSPGCLVTDTASTKVKVMEWAKEYLPPTTNFIGGHPMAGKELSGVEVAEASLFEGCTYCLIPGQGASPEAVQFLVGLLQKIGANPLFITASEHDNFVAAVSHFPFLLSVALVRATTQSHSWGKMSTLAATGYRDLTRLASQHPRMTRDICLTNQQNILFWMDEFRRELDRLRQLVAEDSQKLEEAFIQAQEARQRWLVEKYDKKG
jgi:prephenate dehydrogenase